MKWKPPLEKKKSLTYSLESFFKVSLISGRLPIKEGWNWNHLTRVRVSTIHVRERLKPLPTPLEVEGNDRDHLTGATVNIKVSARPSKKKAIPQSAQNWCTFNSISSNARSPPGCTLMERGVVSAQGVLCEGVDVPIFDLAYVFSSYFVFDVFPRLR